MPRTSSAFHRHAPDGTVGSTASFATPLEPIRSRSLAMGMASQGCELPSASTRRGKLVNAIAAFSPDSSSRSSKPTSLRPPVVMGCAGTYKTSPSATCCWPPMEPIGRSAPDGAVRVLGRPVLLARHSQGLRDLAQDLVEVIRARVPLRLQGLEVPGCRTGPARRQRCDIRLEVAQLLRDLGGD